MNYFEIFPLELFFPLALLQCAPVAVYIAGDTSIRYFWISVE